MGRSNKPTDVFLSIDMTKRDACWPWTGSLSGNGRPYFTLNSKKMLAYAVVYLLVKGEVIPKGKVVRHTCDNPVCCNPAHLVVGSQQDNMNDMKERERHGLPHHTVRAIRKLGEQGRPHQEIAELYGLGRSTVTEMLNNVNYQHVTKGDET